MTREEKLAREGVDAAGMEAPAPALHEYEVTHPDYSRAALCTHCAGACAGVCGIDPECPWGRVVDREIACEGCQWQALVARGNTESGNLPWNLVEGQPRGEGDAPTDLVARRGPARGEDDPATAG